jgi:YgiT-type zinc finger domain-containing protein
MAMIETEVTYSLEHKGRLFLIRHVPARMCEETGEQYFSPDTVEHLQALIRGKNDEPDATRTN